MKNKRACTACARSVGTSNDALPDSAMSPSFMTSAKAAAWPHTLSASLPHHAVMHLMSFLRTRSDRLLAALFCEKPHVLACTYYVW